eukprot:scaffold113_cov96-Isochrysis_galbana.AAC.5
MSRSSVRTIPAAPSTGGVAIDAVENMMSHITVGGCSRPAFPAEIPARTPSSPLGEPRQPAPLQALGRRTHSVPGSPALIGISKRPARPMLVRRRTIQDLRLEERHPSQRLISS